ncbi:MAG: hypothetical protein LBI84_04275 [Propionibacteriaceae bacterium]|nr:hypothetical protein [Propionibacteriaceae bacterium]
MTDPAEAAKPVPAPSAAGDSARKAILLRLDPAVHRALVQWAADELRSANAQIELLIRQGLRQAGRLPGGLKPPRPPGRPRTDEAAEPDSDGV